MNEFYNKKNFPLINYLFGFYYYKVIAVDNYLGLLPVRYNGELIFSLGYWSGYYFSKKLKYAQDNGYKRL